MLKQRTEFRITVNDIEISILFDANCPTPLAKEALNKCLEWIAQLEEQAKKAEEACKKEEPKLEEVTNG